MKILIFSHEFPPDVGGAGVVALENAESLSQLGYDIDVLTRKVDIAPVLSPKINYISTPVIPKLWFLSYFEAVDFSQYDLIFLNDIGAIYSAGLLFPKKLLSKCVCFLHGSEPEYVYEAPSLVRKLTFFKHFYSCALKRSRYIVSPSKYMKTKFLSRCSLDVSEDKIVVSYAGANASAFYRRDSSCLRKKLDISPESIVLLSVGRITVDKGYLEMYEVFKKVVQVIGFDLHWVIVGSGKLAQTLSSMVVDSNLDDKVHFIDPVERSELAFFYSGADLFWLLSNHEESFGLVYLEAQMCGLPAVGRNKGGVSEAISEKGGVLVEFPEECVPIIKDQSWRKFSPQSVANSVTCFESLNLKKQLMGILCKSL